MCSLSLPLCLNTQFTNKPHTNNIISPYLYKNSVQSTSRSYICLAFSSSEREEARWLREEQRWLREEQRWIREESRWRNERDDLLGEIETLRNKIEELEKTQDRNLNVGGVLQVLRNEVSRIAERGSGAVPLVVERGDEVEEEVVEVKEVVRVFEKEKVKDDVVKKRIALRKGSEGDDVRIMQEALQKLGFYCGEEDEEYSMFSSGTERAIKTWQATLRIPEDGIMTAELLEKLYGEQKNDVSWLIEKADIKKTDADTMQKKSRKEMPKKKVLQTLDYLPIESFFLEKIGGKILRGLLAETSRMEAVRKQIPQDAFLVEGRDGYCAQNVMAQASLILRNSLWNG